MRRHAICDIGGYDIKRSSMCTRERIRWGQSCGASSATEQCRRIVRSGGLQYT
jgi:hypothetical protein